jgi:hypothetical protein
MKFVNKASNALTVTASKNLSMTFWQRAASSIGQLEAHHTDDGHGTYAQAMLFGYTVSVQLPFGAPKWALGSRHLKWADYIPQRKVLRKRETRTGRVVGRVFAWALRFPEVQGAIVEQFVMHATPMCGALGRAVSDAVENRGSTVDADNVEGLSRMIEEAVSQALDEHDRHFEIDADSIKDLGDAIEQHLNNDDVRRDFVGEVLSELADRMRG